MYNPERFHASNFESSPPLPTDATRLHMALTTLLREKGDTGNQGDAQYCTLPIPGRSEETALVSNYFTQLVHESYQPSDGVDEAQQESLENKDPVIDIEFRSIAYACFRPKDIRPERAFLIGSTADELKTFPQDQFVLLGPDGLIEVRHNEFVQAIVDRLESESSAA